MATPRWAATAAKPAAKKAAVKTAATRGRISAKAARADARAQIEANVHAAALATKSTAVIPVPASALIETTDAQPALSAPRASRENTTQARVVAMLSTPEGAILVERRPRKATLSNDFLARSRPAARHRRKT